MAEILRDHGRNMDIQHIKPTSKVTSKDYAEKGDPLSSSSDVANKPGSSIPSIFGRMIFFRTALLSIKEDSENHIRWTKGNAAPPYHQIVSQWLDAMEIVFNQSHTLRFECWNRDEQIKRLKETNHAELADALNKQSVKFLLGVNNIFLIFKDGQLIGGTSPFTFVFTSPNWNSGRPVKSLLERKTDFRRFMYRLYCVYNVLNPTVDGKHGRTPNKARETVAGVLQYLKLCLDNETPQLKAEFADPTRYTIADLDRDYDIISVKRDAGASERLKVARLESKSYNKNTERDEVIQTIDMFLLARNASALESDFFIDSPYLEKEGVYDAAKAPLVLAAGSTYGSMFLYDDVNWEDRFTVPQIENEKEDDRPIPHCDSFIHNWLTTIDFLDDALITLPYEMDDTKFKNVINIKGRSYLLPLKAKALAYFPVDFLTDRMLNISVDRDETVLTVELAVPVRNVNGSRRNTVILHKSYNLDADVVYPSDRNMEESLSVGIAPFIRIENPEYSDENRYTVQLQYGTVGYKDISLNFLSSGSKSPIDTTEVSTRGTSPTSVYYKFAGLVDAISLSCKDGNDSAHPEVSGMIIPKMPAFVNGARKFFYSVDFGTTNTHIAFISDEDNATAASFSEKEIAMQAVYLAKKPDMRAFIAQDRHEKIIDAMSKIYGEEGRSLAIAQGQQFFPNFAGTDYSFPIRTAVYEEQQISDNLFGKMSIGFRYHKELFRDSHYRTSIKWDLSAGRTQEAKDRAKMFFEELLLMIRTHWLSQPGSNLSETPVIMLTYPLAMANSSVLNEQWNSAYKRAFGASTAAKFMSMPESLAPAQQLINRGAETVDGILNVDIGGGTTDIQYYRATSGRPIARYNSVLFAGDDLWGTGYENVHDGNRAVPDNIFTRFARTELGSSRLKIGYENVELSRIRHTGKEFVNMLLRDQQRQFLNCITESDNGNNLPRKVVMLHYAALIYHIANWIKADPKMAEKFPSVINFTGFGSKYIEAIFGPDPSCDKLTLYTAELLKAFGIENIPAGFSVNFAENPKAVTAEGAAIFARQGGATIRSVDVRHYGYADSDSMSVLRFKDIDTVTPGVRKFFEDFVKAFNSVEHAGLNIPSLTPAELEKLCDRAVTSFDQVKNYKAASNDPGGESQITDSLFFWMLKGSLFRLDE